MNNIRLLSLELETLALIDDYESLYYEEKYDSVGTCTLTISAFSENFKLIEKDKILFLDTYNCWYIEEINIDNNIATITGLNLSFIFSHRITIPLPNETHLKKKALSGEVIKYLIEETVINSRDKSRNIPFKFTNDCAIGDKINFESRFRNLLEEIESICHYSALGFRVGINLEDKDFIIDIYTGQDLSDEIIFSEVFNNIDDIKIVDSNADYKNVVYIAGQGQGLDRTVLTLTNTDNGGWLRREEMKDARDKELEEDLILEAETILEEKCIKTSIEVLLLGDEEVKIGDIITIISSNYNYRFTQRIIERNVEYTKNTGQTVGIIIGSPKPTLTFDKNESDIIE